MLLNKNSKNQVYQTKRSRETCALSKRKKEQVLIRKHQLTIIVCNKHKQTADIGTIKNKATHVFSEEYQSNKLKEHVPIEHQSEHVLFERKCDMMFRA